MYKNYIVPLLLVLLFCSQTIALEIESSSFIGQAGDSVSAVAIQPDGLIIVAANVSGGSFSVEGTGGVVARLSSDGARLLKKVSVGSRVHDMAIDGRGNIYVASAEGVFKLDCKTMTILWRKDVGRVANRIDAGRDGHCAVLCYDRPQEDTSTGAGQMFVFDAAGNQLGSFKGQHFTIDVCIDSMSKTVIYTGFRNARAWEGKRVFPVQIAFVIGLSYTGEKKYRLYDWPTNREDPGFLNKPTNNMADTRGYRCAVGDDNKLYVAFESAGGNHIFRWEPRLVDGKWVNARSKQPKMDKYHAFYNSRAEHKTFIGRYWPATGEYLCGQEFCARTSSGRANAVRVKHGAITAMKDGSVLLTGSAAASLPVTFSPPGTGDYKGGGFLLVMNPNLSERLACVRILPGNQVKTATSHQTESGNLVVIGGSISEKATEPFFVKNAIQSDGEPGAGFITVIAIEN